VSQSGGPPPERGDKSPDDDPFDRLVLNEDFVRSAEVTEISAHARQRKKRVPWRRRWWGRLSKPLRRRRRGPVSRRSRPSRFVPEWTAAQWVVTTLAVLAAAAYLYFSLGGPA
jgi:hypothetical protein